MFMFHRIKLLFDRNSEQLERVFVFVTPADFHLSFRLFFMYDRTRVPPVISCLSISPQRAKVVYAIIVWGDLAVFSVQKLRQIGATEWQYSRIFFDVLLFGSE